MKMHRAKIGGRMHRTLRNARPAARAMLMTTALAWSIGAPPPATAAAPMARPAATTPGAAGNDAPGKAGGLAASPRGQLLSFSRPSPTPRSTRATRP